MEDLLKAIIIFLQYGNPDYPTHCNHDELTVDIDPELVKGEDLRMLEELGFNPCFDDRCFKSYKFGSF